MFFPKFYWILNLKICSFVRGLENFESLAGSREGSNFNPVLERDRTLLREYTGRDITLLREYAGRDRILLR